MPNPMFGLHLVLVHMLKVVLSRHRSCFLFLLDQFVIFLIFYVGEMGGAYKKKKTILQIIEEGIKISKTKVVSKYTITTLKQSAL
jgi:hypothetical protein